MEKLKQQNERDGLIIEGVCQDDRKFRPSDWVERLSSSLAEFGKDNKLRYSNYAQPCIIKNQKCLVVARGLSQSNTEAFEFIMNFAHVNNLRIQVDRRVIVELVTAERRTNTWGQLSDGRSQKQG